MEEEGRKRSMRRRAICIHSEVLKKICLTGVFAVFLLTTAHPASAAGVPDAGSMMTVAFVAALVLLILVINAVFGVWVYKDAKQRGMKNPVGWIIAVVIAGVPALIGYLFARPKASSASPQQ